MQFTWVEKPATLHLLEARIKRRCGLATLLVPPAVLVTVAHICWALPSLCRAPRTSRADVKFYCPWTQTAPPSWPVKQYLLRWTCAYLKPTHPQPKSHARGERFSSAMFLTRGDQGSTQFIKLPRSFFSWLRDFIDQKIQWLLNDFWYAQF